MNEWNGSNVIGNIELQASSTVLLHYENGISSGISFSILLQYIIFFITRIDSRTVVTFLFARN